MHNALQQYCNTLQQILQQTLQRTCSYVSTAPHFLALATTQCNALQQTRATNTAANTAANTAIHTATHLFIRKHSATFSDQ